jgi:hypothetical protein
MLTFDQRIEAVKAALGELAAAAGGLGQLNLEQ